MDAIRGAIVDSELAGLLWMLLDGGVQLTVAGPGATTDARRDRAAVLAALIDLVPASRTIRPVVGPTDDFASIAAAEGLGWRRSGPASLTPAEPGSTVIAAGELGGDLAADATGDQVRLVVRALGLGFGLAATAEAARLEDLLALLRRRPVGLTDDELTNLGVVLILEGAVDVAPGSEPAGASPACPGSPPRTTSGRWRGTSTATRSGSGQPSSPRGMPGSPVRALRLGRVGRARRTRRPADRRLRARARATERGPHRARGDRELRHGERS